MSTSYALDNPTTKTELLERLAKYGIDEKPPGYLHMHYQADDTGPEEDAYVLYHTESDGTVRDSASSQPWRRHPQCNQGGIRENPFRI